MRILKMTPYKGIEFPMDEKKTLDAIVGKVNEIKAFITRGKIEQLGELFMSNIVVTGGCIPSLMIMEEPNDYDIYFKDSEVAELFAGIARDTNSRGNIVASSPFAVTMMAIETQFITAFSGTPEEITGQFDFLHATGYWTRDTGLVIPNDAYNLIETRQLKYRPNKYPLSSLLRIHKFVCRGWSIGLAETLKVVLELQKYDLTDADTLVEQTKGVDPDQIDHVIDAIKRFTEKGGVVSAETISEFIDDAWENPY